VQNYSCLDSIDRGAVLSDKDGAEEETELGAAMEDLGTKHKQTIRQATQTKPKTPYEVHYRVPRQLEPSTLASHFTQIRTSSEDFYFDYAAKQALKEFSGDEFKCALTEAGFFRSVEWEHILRDAAVTGGTVASHPWFDSLTWEKARDRLKPNADFGRLADEIVVLAHRLVRLGDGNDLLDHGHYGKVLEDNISLFVFGAPRQILFLIGRAMTNENGHSFAMTILFARFRDVFLDYFSKRATALQFDLDSYERATKAFQVDEMGSILAALEASAEAVPALFRKYYDDFRHLEFTHSGLSPQRERQEAEEEGRQTGLPQPAPEAPPVVEQQEAQEEGGASGLPQPASESPPKAIEAPASFSYKLRWSRAPHSWNYTFIESAEKSQSQVERSIDLILAAALNPTVMDAIGLRQFRTKFKFPGHNIAGAHYLFLPISHLIAFTANSSAALNLHTLDQIVARFDGLRRQSMDLEAFNRRTRMMRVRLRRPYKLNARRSLVRIAVALCLDILPREQIVALAAASPAADAILRLGQRPEPAAAALVGLIETSPNLDQNFEVCEFMGELFKAAIQSRGLKKKVDLVSQLMTTIGDLTAAFWECTFAVIIDNEAPDDSVAAVSKDFVCSAMVERRCIYFSNFVPYGEDRFTRTIFLDLGLRPYQRGRILQRLCDLSTYRSIPMRDLDRVRAAVRALDELNPHLNDIQVTLAGLSAGSIIPTTPQVTADRVRTLGEQLDDTLKVSGSVGRMNAFLTYGIAGRWSASLTYFERIDERSDDLREERIVGYALLFDFVRRRLANAKREIERMSIHHATVSSRVGDLLDKIRTQLNVLQTENVGSQTTNVAYSLNQLVTLQRAAEALVLLGGLYYCYSLIDKVPIDKLKLSFSQLLVVTMIKAIGAFAAVVVGRLFAHKLFRWFDGRWEWLQRIIANSPLLSRQHIVLRKHSPRLAARATVAGAGDNGLRGG
jgi:uncharacterized membrane-anchored protein